MPLRAAVVQLRRLPETEHPIEPGDAPMPGGHQPFDHHSPTAMVVRIGGIVVEYAVHPHHRQAT